MKVVRVVVPLVVLALCATAGTAAKGKRKYSQATGPVTAVDTGAKTITVKTRKGEKTIAITEKTTIINTQLAKVAGLAKGQQVRVEGKVTEDKKSIAARRILILSKDSKPRGKGIGKTSALGTMETVGESLTLKTADGATVTITLVKEPHPTLVLKAAKAKFEDLKKGVVVQCHTVTQDGKLGATRVTIRPPELAKRRAKKEKAK